MKRSGIETRGQERCDDPGRADRRDGDGFLSFPEIGEQQKSRGQPHECEGHPRKNWKKPRLRLRKGVHTVDVRLERPREPAWPVRCPTPWCCAWENGGPH